MTKWTSMSVKDTTLERFNRLKDKNAHEVDLPPLSADGFLNALMDEWEGEAGTNANQCENHSEDIKETLDKLERQIDDLQHRLPKEIAEELRG